jgi:hypothetical protein
MSLKYKRILEIANFRASPAEKKSRKWCRKNLQILPPRRQKRKGVKRKEDTCPDGPLPAGQKVFLSVLGVFAVQFIVRILFELATPVPSAGATGQADPHGHT